MIITILLLAPNLSAMLKLPFIDYYDLMIILLKNLRSPSSLCQVQFVSYPVTTVSIGVLAVVNRRVKLLVEPGSQFQDSLDRFDKIIRKQIEI